MVDRIKPLKFEGLADGSSIDYLPSEADPTQDYIAAKGLALENSDNTTIRGDSSIMKFKDSEVTVEATLRDAVERLKLKDIDLTNLNNNYVLTWNTSANSFQLQPAGGAGGGTGVVNPLILSKSGNCTVGTYLRAGEVVTSSTGLSIEGLNTIAKLSVTTSSNIASNTVFQITKRTGVSTFTDISGATVTILSGSYKGESTGLSINIGPDEEIGAYNKSGSTATNVILTINIVPQ